MFSIKGNLSSAVGPTGIKVKSYTVRFVRIKAISRTAVSILKEMNMRDITVIFFENSFEKCCFRVRLQETLCHDSLLE